MPTFTCTYRICTDAVGEFLSNTVNLGRLVHLAFGKALEKSLVGLFRSDANPKALLTHDSHGNFGEPGLSL